MPHGAFPTAAAAAAAAAATASSAPGMMRQCSVGTRRGTALSTTATTTATTISAHQVEMNEAQTDRIDCGRAMWTTMQARCRSRTVASRVKRQMGRIERVIGH
jgi:hypothetical protein